MLPRRPFLFSFIFFAPALMTLTMMSGSALAQSSLLNSGLLHYDPNRNVVTMAPLLDKVTAGVVSINTVEAQATDGTTVGGIGSGVILDADKGLVITNHHVIEDADGITVILGDRREYEAEVLGEDPDTDLALLKIEAENLTALPLADDDMLRVGDYVIAVGNPFGLSSTVTSGIVSAIGREGDTISSYTDYIQTDASINPGNSGGALVNSGGDLVGINASLLSRSGSSSGIGFAIPLYIMRYVADQLETFGTVDRGTMGVMITPVPHRRSEELNLTTLEGALIAEVVAGGPAEAIGLQVDDVITHFAGRTIKDSSDLRYAVGLVRPGTSSDVQFLRAGEPYIQNITIGHKAFSRPVSYQVILDSNTQNVIVPES